MYCLVFAVIISLECAGTLGGRALIYKKLVTDPDFNVDIYNPDKTWYGTTLLADNHRPERLREESCGHSD